MIRFAADYFDGRTSRAHPVEAAVDAGQLRVSGADFEFFLPLREIQVDPPAGRATSVVRLPDDGELHSAEVAALMELSRMTASAHPERWAHRLESRLPFALAALVVAVLVVFAGLRWGVPAAARVAADALPAGVDAQLGRESLALMEGIHLAPSKLPQARQTALANQLAATCAKQRCPAYRLLFRDGPALSANAFALPGGTIVVTDDLVNLAEHDEEILAVIGHELGHVEHRHSLRLALQSVGAGVVLVAITGDLGSVTDLAAGVPTLLLQRGYSRDMEREADAYALAWLVAACIPPSRFADLLGRIADKETDTGLLGSHPGTRERVTPFRTPARC